MSLACSGPSLQPRLFQEEPVGQWDGFKGIDVSLFRGTNAQ